jgi:hypothetical protein
MGRPRSVPCRARGRWLEGTACRGRNSVIRPAGGGRTRFARGFQLPDTHASRNANPRPYSPLRMVCPICDRAPVVKASFPPPPPPAVAGLMEDTVPPPRRAGRLHRGDSTPPADSRQGLRPATPRPYVGPLCRSPRRSPSLVSTSRWCGRPRALVRAVGGPVSPRVFWGNPRVLPAWNHSMFHVPTG